MCKVVEDSFLNLQKKTKNRAYRDELSDLRHQARKMERNLRGTIRRDIDYRLEMYMVKLQLQLIL